MNNALSAARLSAVSDELDTIPGRVRWILANRINPHTQAPWKGNELGRAVLAKSPAHVNMIARGEIKEPSPLPADYKGFLGGFRQVLNAPDNEVAGCLRIVLRRDRGELLTILHKLFCHKVSAYFSGGLAVAKNLWF